MKIRTIFAMAAAPIAAVAMLALPASAVKAGGFPALAATASGRELAAAPAHHGIPCGRLALHVTANGHESLATWLSDHQQTFGIVLHYSAMCSGNDGFMSPWFSRYVDRQDTSLIMRKGTRFWAQWPQ